MVGLISPKWIIFSLFIYIDVIHEIWLDDSCFSGSIGNGFKIINNDNYEQL